MCRFIHCNFIKGKYGVAADCCSTADKHKRRVDMHQSHDPEGLKITLSFDTTVIIDVLTIMARMHAGIAPYMALELCIFDLLPKDRLPPFARGFTAALIATTTAYPLDTIRCGTPCSSCTPPHAAIRI